MNVEALKAQLKRHEGLRLKPYRCSANKLTIGYGRNIEDNGVSEDEAEAMLSNDVVDAINECSRLPGWERCNGTRQQVLVNMLFNMGYSRLLGFRKMFDAIEAEDWGEAAEQMMDSRWAKQVGYRAKELEQMMRNGQ